MIYYYLESDDQIRVMTVYDKAEMDDISPAEKRLLRKQSRENWRSAPHGVYVEGSE